MTRPSRLLCRTVRAFSLDRLSVTCVAFVWLGVAPMAGQCEVITFVDSTNAFANWYDPSAWDLGRVPELGDTVLISSQLPTTETQTLILDGADATVRSVDLIGPGIRLEVSGNLNTIESPVHVTDEAELVVAFGSVTDVLVDGGTLSGNGEVGGAILRAETGLSVLSPGFGTGDLGLLNFGSLGIFDAPGAESTTTRVNIDLSSARGRFADQINVLGTLWIDFGQSAVFVGDVSNVEAFELSQRVELGTAGQTVVENRGRADGVLSTANGVLERSFYEEDSGVFGLFDPFFLGPPGDVNGDDVIDETDALFFAAVLVDNDRDVVELGDGQVLPVFLDGVDMDRVLRNGRRTVDFDDAAIFAQILAAELGVPSEQAASILSAAVAQLQVIVPEPTAFLLMLVSLVAGPSRMRSV